MHAPVTKAQQLAQEYAPRLNDHSEQVDEVTLRRIITSAKSALADAPKDERGVLFGLVGMAYFRLGSFDKALDAHRNAARYEPTKATHANNAAACLLELARVDEALVQLRVARAKPDAGDIMVTIHGNEAEALQKLGAHAAARATIIEAASRVASHNHIDLFAVAMQAAAIGCDDTAAEFFARYLAAAQHVELGETPAVDFIRQAPDTLKVRMRSIAALAAAIQRATERHDEADADGGACPAGVVLSPDAWDKVEALLEAPPEPTEALRELLDGRRA